MPIIKKARGKAERAAAEKKMITYTSSAFSYDHLDKSQKIKTEKLKVHRVWYLWLNHRQGNSRSSNKYRIDLNVLLKKLTSTISLDFTLQAMGKY